MRHSQDERVQNSFTRAAAMLALAVLAPLAARDARAQCDIEGAGSVNENQSFTLCGPRGEDVTYRWSGPGVPNTQTRCITVRGRSAGMYEYTLAVDRNGYERDRCTFVVTVEGPGGTASGSDRCEIVGPSEIASGRVAELCAAPSAFGARSFAWTGPGGFEADSRCIRVTRAGAYQLTIRNDANGRTRSCTHQLVSAADDRSDCRISGAETIRPGERVRLCGTLMTGYDLRWTGPAGFTANSRCIDATRAGTYTLTLRHRTNGDVLRCTHLIDPLDESPDDSDVIDQDNCPRSAAWWLQEVRRRRDLSTAELQAVARGIDDRSAAFAWTNDLTGLAQALDPPAPITRRKRAAQQLATLLANVCAAERGITAANGQPIGLDPDTPIALRSATTIGELGALLDRMLRRATGNFADVNRLATAVNRGQGIGPTCENR